MGNAGRVYLLVFSSNPSSSVEFWTMSVLGDSLDMCLDPYCRVKVRDFYFHERIEFPRDYSKSERSDFSVPADSAPH